MRAQCAVCLTHGIAAADDASELSTFTPAFLWLLRDFYLDLEDEGRKVRSSSHTSAAAALKLQQPQLHSRMAATTTVTADTQLRRAEYSAGACRPSLHSTAAATVHTDIQH
jgi:hypothetical protein